MIRLCVGVVAMLCAAAGKAEKVSLTRALELAEQQHPALLASRAQVDVAQAGILTARAYPNPEVAFVAGRQSPQGPGVPTNGVPLYAVSQPLELGALRPNRIALASRGRESTERALAESRLAVLAQVRRTFFQVLRREGEVAIAGQNLRLVEDLRKRIQVRVDVGEAGRLELIRADAEVAAAKAQASSVELQRVTAIAQFRAAAGGVLGDAAEPEGVLDPPIRLPLLDDIRRETVERHPALEFLRAEIRRAESRLGYEQSLRRPQPALRTEIDMTNPSYRFGLAMTLPVWNQRQGPIAEATAAVRQVTAQLEARRVELLAALEGAYGRYGIASQQVAAFEGGMLREAQEALRAAEAAYQLGERGILEVLDAQRVLRAVRLNELNARFDRQAALIDLDELRAVDLRKGNP